MIWICPIYPSPNVDNGYDVTDHQAIMESYGTMEDFHNLLTECRSRGLKLVMDFVLNHTSTEHPWFKEAEMNQDSKYRDYYIWLGTTDTADRLGVGLRTIRLAVRRTYGRILSAYERRQTSRSELGKSRGSAISIRDDEILAR